MLASRQQHLALPQPPLLAVAADQVLHARLRGGPSHTGRGAKSFLAGTFSRVREAGYDGPIALRADSGFYSHLVTGACARAGVTYSITVKMYPAMLKTVAAIGEDAWVPTPYFLEGAGVAETTYKPFGNQKGAKSVRLIVRRVPPTPGSQLALYTDYSYQAFITNRDGAMLELESDHRAIPRSRTPSGTSSTAWDSTTCPRAASGPTGPGSPSTSWPTTSPAGSRRSGSTKRRR